MSASQVSLKNREKAAYRMAITGAITIRDYLFKMRENYAADSNIGLKNASLWLDETLLHLHENGILVVPEAPLEAAATKWAGDSWHAFQVFEAWLLATRGYLPWDQAVKITKHKAPTPNDVFLMIAIANAFGKSERWLNTSETIWQQTKKAAKLPRINAKTPFKEAVIKVMLEGKNNHQDFKIFMQAWRLGHIDGLTIKTVDKGISYIITDENGELGETTYKWSTLEKMYSEMK